MNLEGIRKTREPSPCFSKEILEVDYIEYKTKGSKRLEKIKPLLAEVSAIEIHNDLTELQDRFIYILDSEIKATEDTIEFDIHNPPDHHYSSWEVYVRSIEEKAPVLNIKLQNKTNDANL